jgi:hypothetical protein
VGLWTEPNPNLELALERRRPGDPDPRAPLPLSLLEELDTRIGAAKNETFVDAWHAAAVNQVRPEHYQRALQLVDAYETDEAPSALDRCRVRNAIANYLESDCVPYALKNGAVADANEYGKLAWQLRDARQVGALGVDVHGGENFDGELVEAWANRAGLVKLCPDDARREQQRAASLYGQRLRELDAAGYILRYAVLTLPNFPQWELGAGLDLIYERFKQTILYARTDGFVARSIRDAKRKFPDLVGAWGCVEAPLSGRFVDGDRSQAWNVHLNLLLVFKPSDELVDWVTHNGRAVPNYEPLRAAWGFDVHFDEIPQGDRNALNRSLRELLKYPLQTVSAKSAEHRMPKRDRHGRLLTPAPPMIAWEPECFAEWWRAHKGYRRVRSWGNLYRGSLVDDEPARRVEWFSIARCSPAGIEIDRPRLSTVADEARARRRAFAHSALISTDPGYRDAVGKRETDAAEHERNARRIDDARRRLALIQGNKSARLDSPSTVVRTFAPQKTGPPHPE